MIIGLTGSFCSGKDTVAEYLVENKGFLHVSLSDELRYELRKKGVEPTRENLIRVGTELRRKQGNGILAQRAMKKCRRGKRCVVTSIRHPAEVRELKKTPGFVLVNVDAPARVRFDRMKKRNRPGDPRTFRDFLAFEEKESQEKGPGQQLKKCSRMADLTLMNDSGDRRTLFRRIEKLLNDVAAHGPEKKSHELLP